MWWSARNAPDVLDEERQEVWSQIADRYDADIHSSEQTTGILALRKKLVSVGEHVYVHVCVCVSG